MKCLIVLSALLSLTVALYTPEYRTELDADALKKLKSDLECYVDKVPCSIENDVFKRFFIEDLKILCITCSPSQIRDLRKFFENSEKYYPELYAEFWAKYDPGSTTKDFFLDYIKYA